MFRTQFYSNFIILFNFIQTVVLENVSSYNGKKSIIKKVNMSSSILFKFYYFIQFYSNCTFEKYKYIITEKVNCEKSQYAIHFYLILFKE